MTSLALSSEQKHKVLLVEDERSLADLYAHYLADEPVEIHHVATGKEALDYLDTEVPDAVLLDIRLPDMLGTDVLRSVNDRKLPTAAIMITAHGSISTAVETMRGGAYDFLVKPFNRDRLVQTLRAALQKKEIRKQVAQKKIEFHETFEGFIGSSKPMQMVYRMIEQASPSKASVFITGESGTGKEVAAEAIHKLSDRNDKPFVVLNCAAIPKNLLESEIFGHVKGAFTGAVTNHDGAATQAHTGTLFLDEICELDLHLQSKLLRFIQSGTFNKVGSPKQEKVDIRFVCATNRDPLEEIGAGRFREDLYYRLHVVPISMPPLRERGKDLLSLSLEFLKRFSEEENRSFEGFTDEVAERIMNYSWPGNVRQLQNIVRNMVVLNEGTEVTVSMLPPPLDSEASMNESTHRFAQFNPMLARQMGITPPPPTTIASRPHHAAAAYGHPVQPAMPAQGYIGTSPAGSMNAQHGGNNGLAQMNGAGDNGFAAGNAGQSPKEPDEIKPLWETEKEAILEAIRSCGGNIPKAAALLGISASTIYRKKQTWEAQEKRRRQLAPHQKQAAEANANVG